MAESFSLEKSRHAPQKEGGWEILCDLPPVWTQLVRPTNLMSRMNGKKTHTHTHMVTYKLPITAENTAVILPRWAVPDNIGEKPPILLLYTDINHIMQGHTETKTGNIYQAVDFETNRLAHKRWNFDFYRLTARRLFSEMKTSHVYLARLNFQK